MHAVNRSIVLFVAAAALCLVTPMAQAQCSWVVTPTTMDFGTYSVFGGAANATTATGSVRCTGALTVTVSSTTGAAGTYNPRQMSAAANYNVYIDAGRTLIWGNGAGGTFTYTFTNTGGPNTYSGFAYGQVPGAQDLAPGTYTDSLNVVMSFRPTSGGATTTLPAVPMDIRMAVVPECRADVFNLPFGNYNPLNAVAVNAASVMKVYCTKNTPATFALDNGANASGVQKRMLNAGQYLNYTATLASGSGTSTSTLIPINGGVALNGSIPAGQDIPTAAAQYIDTLQVVVNY